MIARLALLGCLVLPVGDCIAAAADRREGCDLPMYPDRLFDDRLGWNRVSQEGVLCYLEGFSEDQRIVETQVRYLRTWAEDQCDVSLAPAPEASAAPREHGRAGKDVRQPAFAIAIAAATAEDCATDDPQAPYRDGWAPGVDLASRQIHPATYPAGAIEAGLSGTTMLIVWTRQTGAFGGAIVSRSSGHPALDAAAIDAAEHWTYHPGETADGDPLPGHVAIPVDFRPPN